MDPLGGPETEQPASQSASPADRSRTRSGCCREARLWPRERHCRSPVQLPRPGHSAGGPGAWRLPSGTRGWGRCRGYTHHFGTPGERPPHAGCPGTSESQGDGTWCTSEAKAKKKSGHRRQDGGVSNNGRAAERPAPSTLSVCLIG